MMMNHTRYWPFVEFAVGHFNNKISDASPGGYCKRIVPTGFENVITKKKGMLIDMTFDVITKPGPGSPNQEERITFHVKYNAMKTLETFEAKYVTYERSTKYSPYEVCSDTKSNELKLCICDIEDKKKNKPKQTTLLDLYPSRNAYVFKIKRDDLFLYESISHVVEGHLGLLKREVFEDFEDGKKDDLCSVTFELINHSATRTYEVTVTFTDLDDMKPMQRDECKGIAKPQSMRYLCTVSRSKLSGNGSLKYDVKYKQL